MYLDTNTKRRLAFFPDQLKDNNSNNKTEKPKIGYKK